LGKSESNRKLFAIASEGLKVIKRQKDAFYRGKAGSSDGDGDGRVVVADPDLR
jgi:hypothetical protein